MKVVESNQESPIIKAKNYFLSFIVSADKSITDRFPYKRVLDDGTLVTKNNTYQAYLKVKTTDLTSISEDGFMRLVNKLTYLNRVFLDDFKIVSLTYPTETIEQGMYWKRRIAQAKRELFNNEHAHLDTYLKWNLKLAYDNLSRVDFVSTLPELTFSIVVYGKTRKELKNNVEVIRQAGGKELNLRVQTQEEVTNIVKKLLNMNSPL
ncbi:MULTISPECIES: hypothetical protein [Vagococcus]|uniref:Uncharacterized protein n=1 Tax=Vagococcus fluvialis bH819 TaxID=1255619 RepID=A0A1X6WS52_9ENTE|nr:MULTISPECIES: hypothetical protein [Vagococcus]SLM87079.1 hypothetical protein FM121_13355 [Vagococcus fluvialis bH819]HCM90574.1 hypothetical protein [Vagococcus sp.]